MGHAQKLKCGAETQWKGWKSIETTIERDQMLDIRKTLPKSHTSKELNEMMHKKIQGYNDDGPSNKT